jgi:hypothetical protein
MKDAYPEGHHMATAADPVRRTLDTHSVASDAASERPYLESMLRRLGYSESEIQAYITGREPMPQGLPQTEAEAREVEIEYTGPGIREFKLVVGVDESELPVTGGMEAGTEVFAAGPSMEEVDALVASGEFGDFDDWGDTGKPQGEGAAAASDFEGDGEGEAAEGEGLQEGGAAEGAGAPAEAAASVPTEFALGEGMVEFKETPLNEAVVEPVDAAQEADALKAEGWEVADLETGRFEEEQEGGAGMDADDLGGAPGEGFQEHSWEAPAGDGFEHNGWHLYSRDELRGDQPQRIYFFSRDPPDGGEPAEVPDGYEVAENPETGRPFLRRAQGGEGDLPGPVDIDSVAPGADPAGAGAPPRKRVRIQRVRAASREEAAKKMEAEGRSVLGSMPIDIEKHLGEP